MAYFILSLATVVFIGSGSKSRTTRCSSLFRKRDCAAIIPQLFQYANSIEIPSNPPPPPIFLMPGTSYITITPLVNAHKHRCFALRKYLPSGCIAPEICKLPSEPWVDLVEGELLVRRVQNCLKTTNSAHVHKLITHRSSRFNRDIHSKHWRPFLEVISTPNF